ncbi:Cys-tRNA(Pro) deacylase [Bacillota bacterium Lsc_1132]
MAQTKTNAMRILDANKIPYEMLSYDHQDSKIDGVSVAAKIGRSTSEVFKTLVAQGASKTILIFVIPVDAELDLKKAAKEAGEKKVEMVPVKDIQKWTGYIRGGCSPIGMKKDYRTFIDESCQSLETMVVSGGKIGLQVVIEPNRLKEATKAQYAKLTKG